MKKRSFSGYFIFFWGNIPIIQTGVDSNRSIVLWCFVTICGTTKQLSNEPTTGQTWEKISRRKSNGDLFVVANLLSFYADLSQFIFAFYHDSSPNLKISNICSPKNYFENKFWKEIFSSHRNVIIIHSESFNRPHPNKTTYWVLQWISALFLK